jgi:homoserine dehydrogenase
MAAIAKSMGEHGVSIRQAVQKGEPEQGHVPIVFLTHEAPTRAVKAVLAETALMSSIKSTPVHFRVL